MGAGKRLLRPAGAASHGVVLFPRAVTWRILYRIDGDAVIIAEVFAKKTSATPKLLIDTVKRRLAAYDAVG